jgi:formate hydrogenlyase subunit 3/multisubunit Na+/H+ antiporter MnhD subunit
MFWYGIFYYLLTIGVIYSFLFFYYNLKTSNTLVFLSITNLFTSHIFTFYFLFFIIPLNILYYIFTKYSRFQVISINMEAPVDLFYTTRLIILSSSSPSNYNLLSTYAFPFVYVFIIITTISIIYSLIYNFSEFYSFIYFVILISFAGAGLFLTDSFLLFFFFYEALLIPSFFILYRFGKTRRSIEAAYSMFF